MATELQAVVDAICVMQEAITPPTGEADIKHAYDEPPAEPKEFPCFVNIEAGLENIQLSGSHRHIDHLINMHLLFAPSSQKYAVRLRRQWVQPVLDKFQGKIQLGIAGVNLSRIETVTYEPLSLNDREYVTATFLLRVRVDDAFAAAA